MRESNCLICNSTTLHLHPPPPPNTLGDQLRAIFLLRNIFELPSWTLQKYLISAGDNPSQWLISVCPQCDPLVTKTRQLYEEILKAKRKFRRARNQLVERLRQSRRNRPPSRTPPPPGFTHYVSISDECRQFVEIHDYGETENPFTDGDNRARALTVTRGLPDPNVKMEIFELNTAESEMDEFCPNMDIFGFSPEGESDDDGGGAYHDDNDDLEYDDQKYVYIPPGPKCHKRQFAKTKCIAVDESNLEEIPAAQASSLIQFLTTSRGKRMVRYDGHNFYNDTNSRAIVSPVIYFTCKWRRYGCPARIGLKNYKDDDGTYTSFIPNGEAHDHAHSGRDTAKDAIWYEVNSLAKEIVRDNVNAPVNQVFQMVQDSFLSDPEVTEELSKAKVQNNLRKLIANTKRKLGWKPDTNMKKRKFIGTRMQRHDESSTAEAEGSIVDQVEAEVTKPETGMDILKEELTSAQASSLIQFLTTSRGKRMVRYDGHNFYNDTNSRASATAAVTFFTCKWRRYGCPARIGLRNYKDEEASYTSFIPNAEAHHHQGAPGQGDTDLDKKQALWYEVNSLVKEIVKDNVNAPPSQVLQMVQDSFISDPDVIEELSQTKVQNNLRKLIANSKRRLGWKPDPNVPMIKRNSIKKKIKKADKININQDDHDHDHQHLQFVSGESHVNNS